MDRRGFLGVLLGGAVDPDRLLWTPGKKLISLAARVHVPQFHHFSCAFPLPGLLPGERLDWEALRPGIRLLQYRIDEAVRAAGDPVPTFQRLELTGNYEFGMTGPLAPLPHLRYIQVAHFNNTCMVGRLDVRVKI